MSFDDSIQSDEMAEMERLEAMAKMNDFEDWQDEQNIYLNDGTCYFSVNDVFDDDIPYYIF